MTRKLKVTVTARDGILRLRLPRAAFNGEQRYLYLGLADTLDNRREARTIAQTIELDIANNRLDTSLESYRQNWHTVPALGELWDEYTHFKAKFLAPTTIKNYKNTKSHIDKLPTQRIEEARTIRRFIIETVPYKSARRTLMNINACCKWALEEEIIPLNPFDKLPKLKRKKVQKPINPFSPEERDLIIDTFQNHSIYYYYTPFIKFLFWTGCRTSEAIGLQWQHIDNKITTITFTSAVVDGIRKGTKTYKTRYFPINYRLKHLLKEIRPNSYYPEDAIFTSKQGCLINRHAFRIRAWKPILESLPISYRPQYNTRHTFITLCLKAGIDVAQVATWVGNTPQVIWSNYAGVIGQGKVPEV